MATVRGKKEGFWALRIILKWHYKYKMAKVKITDVCRKFGLVTSIIVTICNKKNTKQNYLCVWTERIENEVFENLNEVTSMRRWLNLVLLTWTIWRAPTNASKWRMEYNSAFKGLREKWRSLHYSSSSHGNFCST